MIFFQIGVLVSAINAQEKLVFSEKEKDFGERYEEDDFFHSFYFTNNGLDSIRITSVNATCGCTAVNWTKNWLQPKDTGGVDVRYLSHNRPGSFEKSIEVIDSKGAKHRLQVKGRVLQATVGLERKYPVRVGNLGSGFRVLSLGNVTNEASITKAFPVYNFGNDSLIFIGYSDSLDHLTVRFSPDTLLPKSEGEILVDLFVDKIEELGYASDSLLISTSDEIVPNKKYLISYSLIEFFPPLSESELANAAKLAFNYTKVDFGLVSVGEIATEEVQLINEGNRPLNIRKIDSNCDCLMADLESEDIEPDSYTLLKLAFDPNGRKGRQYKTITVFSNDPTAPVQVISIRANIR